MLPAENEHTEYKERLTDGIEKEAVAFLNADGGSIIIGVQDDGEVVGIANADKLQLQIKDRLLSNIAPSILHLLSISAETIDNKTVLKINLKAGAEKPYYIKSKGLSESGVFVRIGSSAQPMPADTIEKMFARRVRNNLRVIDSPKQKLTFEQLKIYYETLGKNLTEQFASNLELLTDDGKYNYVAYLLADINVTSIKVAKYAGLDRYYLSENNEYGNCSLIKSTKAVLEKFEIENKTFAKITYKERLERSLWDRVALREAILNAILHNDYTDEAFPKFEIFDDRLEITSYGGLPYNLSEEEFFNGVSRPRNKELMRVFRDVELVEYLGSGMPRIMKAYNRENFVISENFIRLILPKNKPFEQEDDVEREENVIENREKTTQKSRVKSAEKSAEKSNLKTTQKSREKSREKIIELMKNDSQITQQELAAQLSLSIKTIEKNIKILKSQNLLRREGPDKGGYWVITEKEKKSK
jgi:predicted HTH transcriptional regulator